jgi:hypothetical protein
LNVEDPSIYGFTKFYEGLKIGYYVWIEKAAGAIIGYYYYPLLITPKLKV